MVALDTGFARGLLAYVRQAALSLDRAPENFETAMAQYYANHEIPAPERVANALESHAALAKGKLRLVLAIFGRRYVIVSDGDLDAMRNCLAGLASVLNAGAHGSQLDRVTLRLELSELEETLRRKLPRRAARIAESVEHLNQGVRTHMKPLKELAGPKWPAISSRGQGHEAGE